MLEEWDSTPNKYLSAIAYIIYVGIIIIDMHEWFWLTQANPIYYYIILVHTLPILVILSKLKINIKSKQLFLIGLSTLLAGFLFDAVYINIPYQDVTDEIYERNMLLEKTRNVIYFVGFITIAFAVITLKRIKSQKASIQKRSA